MNPFYLTAVQLSLCLGPMAMGIFISMKVFKIPDITTDGSYTLGAAVTAVLMTGGYPLWAVMPLSMLAGALGGTATGYIHTKLKIDALLAGILVMTSLYSINLIILGRSNVPLIGIDGFFSLLRLSDTRIINELIMAGILVFVFLLLLVYILRTDFGIAMRATGNNPFMTRAMGVDNDRIKIMGLAMANGLTALSGSLMAQFQHFSDINMGIGIVITGLGSVLMADALARWLRIQKIGKMMLLVLVGSVIFQMVLAVTLSMGIDPNLLKLVTSLFVLVFVALPRLSGRKEAND